MFVTISTVGYGDIAPTTATGRAVACVLYYVGTVLMALPVGVIGAHFSHNYYLWQADEIRARMQRGSGSRGRVGSGFSSASGGGGQGGQQRKLTRMSSSQLRRMSYVTRSLSDSGEDVSDLERHIELVSVSVSSTSSAGSPSTGAGAGSSAGASASAIGHAVDTASATSTSIFGDTDIEDGASSASAMASPLTEVELGSLFRKENDFKADGEESERKMKKGERVGGSGGTTQLKPEQHQNPSYPSGTGALFHGMPQVQVSWASGEGAGAGAGSGAGAGATSRSDANALADNGEAAVSDAADIVERTMKASI